MSEYFTGIAGYRLSRFQSTHADNEGLALGELPQRAVLEEPAWLQSPRAALIYHPTRGTSVKLLYGEAFRLPTPFEKHATFLGVIATLPEVGAENIRTFEIGLETQPAEDLNLRLNGHYSMLDRLIDRRKPVTQDELDLVGGQPEVGLYDNFLKGNIYGIEASVRLGLARRVQSFWNLSWTQADYETLRPEFEAIGVFPRPLPAKWTASAGLSWQALPWLVLHPNAQYVGSRGEAAAYTLVNGVVDVTYWKPWTLSVIGNNLFDRRYEYPEYVRRNVGTIPGGPGRALYARALYRF
jgi:outer membrane receptor protein involved in Fe transport